ncbi:MAG: MFS transporter [Acidobacteria bacterium]|nr:MFS transporter [Acidobacteriota bacterium]
MSAGAQSLASSPLGRFAPQATFLLILVALIDSQLIGAIAPNVAEGLGVRPSTVAWGVTAYAIAAACVALWLALWHQLRDSVKWLPRSALLFGLGSLITATAPHIGIFFAGRAVAGFAGGMISALAIAALANSSNYDRRGRRMSWVAVAYFLAPVFGVPVGALLAGGYGWRPVFAVSAALSVAAAVLVAMLPLPSVISDESRDRHEPVEGRREGIAGLWQLATRTRSTRLGIVSAFFVSGGLVGFTSFLGIWLTKGFGASPRAVSLVYLAAGIGAVGGGAIGGLLADRIGKRRVSVASSKLMALALLIVPAVAWGTPLFVLIAVTALFASIRVAPLQALVTEIVARDDRAVYIALRNAASQLGIATAVAVSQPAYDRFGMVGVGVVCCLATLIAWIGIARIDDPHDRSGSASTRSRLASLARVSIVAILAAGLGLPWMFSILVTKAGTRPDERDRPDTPATLGASFEDVTFTSVDGNTVSGWWLDAAGRRTTIVMTHGLFRSRWEVLARAVDFWKRGYSVLVYDLRRHGRSGGEFVTLGYDERHDVEAALEYARTRAPGNRMVLFGVSMGGAATLMAAAESTGLTAVVADSSFLSLAHTVDHHLKLVGIPPIPFAPVLTWMTALRLGFLPGQFDVRDAVRRTSVPVLFIGGTDDQRMPVETVLRPLAAASSNPLSRTLVIEGAGHGHAYATSPGVYVDAVDEFLLSVP